VNYFYLLDLFANYLELRNRLFYFGQLNDLNMTSVTEKLPFHKQMDIAMDGRTNRVMAEKTGIHESEISRIKSGRLNPTPEQIEKIVAALPDYTFDLA
jgi:transcriptional regulator with XRE-family HTH domain